MTDAASAMSLPRPSALDYLRGDARSDFLSGRPALLRLDHTVRPDASTARPALLWPSGAVAESWESEALPGPPEYRGCVEFRTDGRWLAGTARVDERTVSGGISAAAEQAYGAIFALLAAQEASRPPLQLLRLWNYMADINAVQDGVERYRLFNTGRQRAFQQADRSAFEGAPAACALGADRGPVTVHFLAGPVDAVSIENPRQVSAYRYPTRYGPSSPTFSRAAAFPLDDQREALLISGTASIVGHESQHPGDVEAQVVETLRNIDAILEGSARLGRATHARDALDCTVYVRRPDDLERVRRTFESIVGPQSRSAMRAIYLRADICRADLLVEIEAQSIAAVGRARRLIPISKESA